MTMRGRKLLLLIQLWERSYAPWNSWLLLLVAQVAEQVEENMNEMNVGLPMYNDIYIYI